jgi:hypothetical protein
VALESHREDFYIQLFDSVHRPLCNPTAETSETLCDVLSSAIGASPLAVAGDAARRVAAILSHSHRSRAIVIDGSVSDAASILRAVFTLARRGESRTQALPLYLRPPYVTFSTRRQGLGR